VLSSLPKKNRISSLEITNIAKISSRVINTIAVQRYNNLRRAVCNKPSELTTVHFGRSFLTVICFLTRSERTTSRRRSHVAAQSLEVNMKGLAIVAALLIGGASLAMAQNGPATGGQRPVAGGAAGGPKLTTPSHHKFKHHRMYMSTTPHKHKHMKQAPTQG
jgi:hypothetical protein